MKEKILHIGCGDRYIPGFIHIDVRKLPHLDYVTPADKLDMFDGNSVDLIYSCHLLEHFRRGEIANVLKEWYRVLKPGGILRIAVPDFEKLVEVYLKTKDLRLILGPLVGRQDYPENTHYLAPQFISINENKGTPSNPLVSIITPVLNGIKYLEICIQSVLNQSYPHIEHVFVDGGSTDGTVDMLASYRAKYPDRIRFISEPDKGIGEAWNKGLRMAKGKIFGVLGSDDMSESDAIMTVVEFFRANPDAYFVFGDCNYINENGKIIGKYLTKDFNLKEIINDLNPIPGTSAFYKREVVERVGFMDASILACDLDYWIRVGKVFQIHRIEKVLSNFRIHKGSSTASKGTGKIYAREGFIVSRRYGGSIFSPRGRMYIIFLIIRPLLPVLVRIYYLIKYKTKV